MSNKILVLGGTGKTGKRIADRLKSLGMPVRIGSRNADPAFDWENSSNWKEVMKEVEKVYISFQPDVAVPGSVEKINTLVNTAKLCGVKQLVLLSGRGEEEAQRCENIVINSGLDWSVVRSSFFMQNFSEGFLLDGIMAGHVVMPVIHAREPFIDVADIADVVIKLLIDDKYKNKIVELTGPELLTFENLVHQISAALRRPIVYEEISTEKYAGLLRSYETPEDLVWLITYLFTEILDGRNESITNDVELILGRKAGSLEGYINKVIKAGQWQTSALMNA